MNCLVCRDPMIVLELDQVEVDHCLACGGIWLDQGELELILEGASEKDRLLSSFQAAGASKEKKRKCPICSKKMEKVFCGGQQVQIDRCPRKDGLWFDLGELEQIVKAGSFNGNKEVVNLLKDMFNQTVGRKPGGVE